MKKLNYAEIMKESEDKEISAFLIIKRLCNYREAMAHETHRCKNCREYESNVKAANRSFKQCVTIGIGCDGYSEIDPEYTCDAYK